MGIPEDLSQNQMSHTNNITESEKKRLLSLKQKRQAFKTKENLIRKALNDSSNVTRNNKITFDEYDDEERPQKRKKALFDADEDTDEDAQNPIEFDIKDQSKKNQLKLSSTSGFDKRFVLDERFIEDNEEEPKQTDGIDTKDPLDLQNEKNWQLNILENVLKVPIAPKNDQKNTNVVRKSKMIRYDPTEQTHKEYEVKPEDKTHCDNNVKSQELSNSKAEKKMKAKKSITDGSEDPLPVSKEIYYSVSDNLTEALKQPAEGFSLLRTYGKEENIINEKDKDIADIDTHTRTKFNFQLAGKNPFKYDSSDDENEVEEKEKLNVDSPAAEKHIDNLFRKNDTFFFRPNDSRFDDAFKFFTNVSISPDEFKYLRRELKQIVRSKVRNNVRRSQPWGKKKLGKRS